MSLSTDPTAGPVVAEPLTAAREFALSLQGSGLLERTWRLTCELRGGPVPSGLPGAVMLGLEGVELRDADVPATARQLRRIRGQHELRLLGGRRIAFDPRRHWSHAGSCASEICGLRLSAFDPAGRLLLERSYFVSATAAA